LITLASFRLTLAAPRNSINWHYNVSLGAIELRANASCSDVGENGISERSIRGISIISCSASACVDSISCEVYEVPRDRDRRAYFFHFGNSGPTLTITLSSPEVQCAETGALVLRMHLALADGNYDVDVFNARVAADLVSDMLQTINELRISTVMPTAPKREYSHVISYLRHAVLCKMDAALARSAVRAILSTKFDSVCLSFLDATLNLSLYLPLTQATTFPLTPQWIIDAHLKLSGVQLVASALRCHTVELPSHSIDLCVDFVHSQLSLGCLDRHDFYHSVFRSILPTLNFGISSAHVKTGMELARQTALATAVSSPCQHEQDSELTSQAQLAKACHHIHESPIMSEFADSPRENVALHLRRLNIVDSHEEWGKDVLSHLAHLPLATAHRLEHKPLTIQTSAISFDDHVEWIPAGSMSSGAGDWWGYIRVALDIPMFFCDLCCVKESTDSRYPMPTNFFQRLQRRFPGLGSVLVPSTTPASLLCLVEGLVGGLWVLAGSFRLLLGSEPVEVVNGEPVCGMVPSRCSVLSRCWRVRWHEPALSMSKLSDFEQDIARAKVCYYEPYRRFCEFLVDHVQLTFSLSGRASDHATRTAISELYVICCAPKVDISLFQNQRSSVVRKFASLHISSSLDFEAQRPSRLSGVHGAAFSNGVFTKFSVVPSLRFFDSATSYGADVFSGDMTCSVIRRSNRIKNVDVRIADMNFRLSPSQALTCAAGVMSVAIDADLFDARPYPTLQPLLVNTLDYPLMVRQAGVLQSNAAVLLAARSMHVYAWPLPTCEVYPSQFNSRADPRSTGAPSCRALQFSACGTAQHLEPWSSPVAMDCLAAPRTFECSTRLHLVYAGNSRW